MFKGMSFWEVVAADAKRVGGSINPHASFIARQWQAFKLRRFRPGFASVFWLRVNQRIARKRFSVQLRNWRQYRFANDISEFAKIGPGFWLPHHVDVTIGSGVIIGANSTIFNGVTLGGKRLSEHDTAMPTLGNNVVVYTGAKLIGGITVGDNVEIGALALCIKDVPTNSVMYGIPPNITVKPK
jgi:serine O-acetyltransferase